MNDRSTIRSSRYGERLAVALSVLAVLMSGAALWEGRQQHSDERASELMARIYEDWEKLSLVDHWEVAHLIDVPGTYEDSVERLRAYVASLPEAEVLRIRILEQATAGRIFGIWEHHVNQWRIAVEADDAVRMDLLRVELDYWAREQLRNPRLLWYFSPEGGGLYWWTDEPNREIYRQHVLENPDHPLLQQPDPLGPFPAGDGS